MNKKGFTLIELMIVVVIIGILAAIAIPRMQNVTGGARQSSCRANMRTILTQAQIYMAEEGIYPDDAATLGTEDITCPAGGNYTYGHPSSYEFNIGCDYNVSPYEHGEIVDGVASWAE